MAFPLAALVSTLLISGGNYLVQARDRRRRERAADARKGLTITVPGEPGTVPVAYGRVALGTPETSVTVTDAVLGNSFTAAGVSAPTGGSVWGSYGGMGVNREGSRNEFLTVQYALARKLSAVNNIDLDGSPYDSTELRYGQRLHVFESGGVADPLATNNGLPATNVFKDCAYMTGAFRLNRDDPQYNGIPAPTVYALGEPVRSVVRSGSAGSYTYALSSKPTYSNNPARCLLDYLTQPYGGGLGVDEVDLESFHHAQELCERVVNATVVRRGKVWKPSTSGIVLNTVEQGGEKFLALVKPGDDPGNFSLSSLGTKFGFRGLFTDSDGNDHTFEFEFDGDDLVTDIIVSPDTPPDTSVALPLSWFADQTPARTMDPDAVNTGAAPASGKYGYWDRNLSGVYTVDQSESSPGSDLDLKLYECNFITDPERSVLHNARDMALCMGQALVVPSQGRIKLVLNYPTSDAEEEATVTRTIDDSGLSMEGTFSVAHPGLKTRKNEASVDFHNEQLDFKRDTARWPEYAPSSDTQSPYRLYAEEDGGRKLVDALSLSSVSDPYHAMARAEQIVRSSRTESAYEMVLGPEGLRDEPGDTVKVSSNTFHQAEVRIRLTSVQQYRDQLLFKVRGHSVDYRNLAYNAPDDIANPASDVYDFGTAPPVMADPSFDEDSRAVTLTWTDDSPPVGAHYVLEARLGDDGEWFEITRTRALTAPHDVGPGAGAWHYRVRTVAGGRLGGPSNVVSQEVEAATTGPGGTGKDGKDAPFFLASVVEVPINAEGFSIENSTSFSPNPADAIMTINVQGTETSVTVRGAVADGGLVTPTLVGDDAADFEIVT